GDKSLFKLRTNSEYNFYLIFENGEARIYKDGVELDVYGGGFYNEESQWFVPGYENFPANEQLDGVTVYMAVRANPVRYYSVDYETGSQYSNNRMYWIAQKVEQANQFYRTQAALCGSGVLLLCVWFLLRRHKRFADAKIASWTVHVWTEARFVLGLLLVVCLICGRGLPEFYYGMRELCWAMDDGYYFSVIGLGMSFLRLLLGNIPVLLMLVWFFWLIHNDHRHNPKEARRSLLRPFLRALRAKDLKRPVEKRISRRAALFVLMAVLLAVEMLSILINMTLTGYPSWLLWTVYLLPVLLMAGAAAALARRELGLARDLGLLADQVETVRAGNLSTPLKLPEDADLQKTAESLNDIQAGMKAALEEQTRSERMKVELVSNVSHDLKTPLTSILSYAELLRQEDLPPAAADYARIIDEKAQRLKGMVQDVFEVSKAAADQLPVQMERLDLAKLLRQTLADLDGPIQRSALTFKIDLPEEPVMITADGKRLYRIFQNLIDNALRYALEGSRVYLTLNTSEEQADVSVRNTSRTELPEGVDFTARFVRGDASRTDGGSGLGLSIVKSFVEACGGCFRVETVADLFTAVVTFPLSM
ncbi:MAG: HAMP domain-containing histidine kinase, partial [Oscillibacter sp.]|nr:HAMP domain-containing histidine kinase [Oscillibacter sp.]